MSKTKLLIFAFLVFASSTNYERVNAEPICYDYYKVVPCALHLDRIFHNEDWFYKKQLYIDTNKGSIVDLEQGIMWMKSDDGVTRSLESAMQYCENLLYSGFDDWRIPTARELFILVDYTRACRSPHPAFRMNSWFYWAYGEYGAVETKFFGVFFDGGGSHINDPQQKGYVRCARSIE
jgi:hypothetical protein